MAREQRSKGRGLAYAALAVLALAGMLSYAQDNPTPPAPPQIGSTTKIDVIGSAQPSDGSDTAKAWQSSWQSFFRPAPIMFPPPPPPLPPQPVPLLPGGILGSIDGFINNLLGQLLGGGTGGTPAAPPGNMPGGLPAQIQDLLNGMMGGGTGGTPAAPAGSTPSGLPAQIQNLLNGVLGAVPGGAPRCIIAGGPGGMPGGFGGGNPGGGLGGLLSLAGGFTTNGNSIFDAVVEMQSQTTVDFAALGANAPQFPAPTQALRGDITITGNNLPLRPSYDGTQPHLDANSVMVVVKGDAVYAVGAVFGLSAQDWAGLKKLASAPQPHLKKVLAAGGKPLTAAQETALHIDLEEQLVDSAGNLAAAPGNNSNALDFARKFFSLWQATLGDEPGFAAALQAVLTADQWTLVQSTPVVMCAGKPRFIPALEVTSLAASPNPATAGKAVTFTAAVVGANASVVWDFGDGTKDTSNALSVTHTYSTAGVYQVSITANVSGKQSDTAQTCLVVLTTDGQPPPILPWISTGIGTGTTTGTSTGTTDLQNALALVINALQALVKQDATGNSSVFTLSGVLPSSSATLSGASVDVSIGGLTVSFTLDKKGNGKAQGSSVQLKAKSGAKKARTSGSADVNFRAKLALNQLPPSLPDTVPTNAKGKPVKQTVALPISITLNGQVYSTTVTGQYVTNGKRGKLSK